MMAVAPFTIIVNDEAIETIARALRPDAFSGINDDTVRVGLQRSARHHVEDALHRVATLQNAGGLR